MRILQNYLTTCTFILKRAFRYSQKTFYRLLKKNTELSQPLFVYFRPFHIAFEYQIVNSKDVCLGLEHAAAGLWALTDPLSYGGCPFVELFPHQIFLTRHYLEVLASVYLSLFFCWHVCVLNCGCLFPCSTLHCLCPFLSVCMSV